MNQLNVLYQSDKNAQLALGVSISSLMLNNRAIDEINIYLIDDGIDPCFCNQLLQYVTSFHRKLMIIPSNFLLEQELVKEYLYYPGQRKNKHSYLKLFWDLAITNEIERLLYIDCDTVIERDLSELITFDMEDNYIGMVLDSLITDEIQHIDLNPMEPYFNSGVILFDCKKWKDNNCSKRAAYHKKRYGTVDQDLLNVEFRNNIAILPLKYNYQLIHMLIDSKRYSKEFKRVNYYTQKEIEKTEGNACIIHFLKFTGQSVWNKRNIHPCKKIFEKYLSQTPWKFHKRNKAESRLIFVIEKILYIFLPRNCFIKVYHMAHKRMIERSNMIK